MMCMYQATRYSTFNSDTTGQFFLDNCLSWECGSGTVSHLQVRFSVMDGLRNPKVTEKNWDEFIGLLHFFFILDKTFMRTYMGNYPFPMRANNPP